MRARGSSATRGSCLGSEDRISPRSGTCLAYSYTRLAQASRGGKPSVCKEFRKPVTWHTCLLFLARGALSSRLAAPGGAFAYDSPQVLDCLKLNPYTCSSCWFARELFPERASRSRKEWLVPEKGTSKLSYYNSFDFNLEQLTKPQFPHL